MKQTPASSLVSDTGTPGDPGREAFVGGVYAFAAYLIWGFLPIYFLALAPSTAFEVVAWRIALSFVFCALLLTVTRGWTAFIAIARQPRLLLWMGAAGLLILVNWTVYLLGTLSGHVIEASLGYFINPIVTVLLAVIVLRERLSIAQWVAIGIALVAVGVIVVGYGAFPWIALTLAFSFGLYGLVKKQLGASVDPISGLTLESLWLTPIAIVTLLVIGTSTGLTVTTAGTWHGVLLLLAGVVTAIPLLLFAAGTRRAPLSIIGLLQFVAPIIQFAIGVWVLGEPMPLERWIGFALVWVALIVLTVDSFAGARKRRRVDDVATLT